METLNLLSIKEVTNFINKYRTQFITGIILISIVVSSLIYWQYSRIAYEQNALQGLSEVLTEYNQAYGNSELWQDVEVGARTGYRQFSGSSLGVFFLGLQADAMIQQNKLDDAIILMDTMLKKFSTYSPFYYMYAIKIARMKLASENAVTKEEGLQQLLSLSQDSKNPQQQQAQYYLGLYYQTNEQLQKADELLNSLISADEKSDKRSVWAMMAEQQIKQG